MLLFDKYDAQVFTDALAIELRTEPDAQIASKKVMENLDRNPAYYTEQQQQADDAQKFALVGVQGGGKVLMRPLAKGGKKAAVGEVREYNGKKYKKQADGEWLPVQSGKQKTDKEETPKKKKKTGLDPSKNPELEDDKEEKKAKIKAVIKKMVSALADTLSGRGATAAAQTVEQSGEGIEAKGHEMKAEEKKKERTAKFNEEKRKQEKQAAQEKKSSEGAKK